jgi:hypothetical protein
MILEVAILHIRPGESADFERALAEAQVIIAGIRCQRIGNEHMRCSAPVNGCSRSASTEGISP